MMIYKIKKELFKQAEAFAVCSAVGEVPCLIKPLQVGGKNMGYYIYNTKGEGIAQLSFEGGTAVLATARKRGFFPGSIKLTKTGKETFYFDTASLSKEDEVYAKKLKGVKDKAYSVWGNTNAFSYDIYFGNEVAANVIPVSEDPTMLQMKVGDVGNFLVCLMIVLALEKLNANAK